MSADTARSVALSKGLWRGVDVVVEPPTLRHPMRHFSEHGAALDFAAQLALLNGWPLHDRTAVSDG